jgi:hypothetical protein
VAPDMMVYFVRAVGTPYVKIGKALHFPGRLIVLQCANPHKLELVREIHDVDASVESAAHTQFAHLHVRGEWFTFSEEMLTWDPQAQFVASVPNKAKVLRTIPSDEAVAKALSQYQERETLQLEDVLAVIHAATKGNIYQWSVKNGISPSYTSDVLRRRKAPGRAILDIFNLVKVIKYDYIQSGE